MITENLLTLKIHKLTQEQYERERKAGRLDEHAIYLTPDNGSGSVGSSVQADWTQTNETSTDYIKNKPGDTITTTTEINNSYTTATLGAPDDTSPFVIWYNVSVTPSEIYDDIQDNTPFTVSYLVDGEVVEIDSSLLFTSSILDDQFGVGSSQTGYYGIVNSAQTIEEVLTQGVWTRADSSKPTFCILLTKSNTSGQSWLNISAPELLTGNSFTLTLHFIETKTEVVRLPMEALSFGSECKLTNDKVYDLMFPLDHDVVNENLKMLIYACDIIPETNVLLTAKFKNKTTQDFITLGSNMLIDYNFDGSNLKTVSFNTKDTFYDVIGNEAITRDDDSKPAVLLTYFIEDNYLYLVTDLESHENYDFILSYDEDGVIGLPDIVLGKEFKNVGGKLQLALGDMVSTNIEIKNSYTTTLGTTFATSPFVLYQQGQSLGIDKNVRNGTPITVSYVVNGESVEIETLSLFTNSMLDAQFGLSSSEVGHWALVNAAQSLEEILTTGVWTRADASKPTIMVCVGKPDRGNPWLTIGAPELLNGSTFVINLTTWNTEISTITLSNTALNLDSVPTQGSTNFINSGDLYNIIGDIDTAISQLKFLVGGASV